MYKKQLTLQKFTCLLALVSSVIVFLYSLGIMTDLYDSLYSTMMNPADLTQTYVPGSIIYYDMQPFNSAFLRYSIVLILLACLLYITNTHIRRKYYIGNWFAILAFAAANVYVAYWGHQNIEQFKAQFLQIDFSALQMFSQMMGSAYTDSTFWFDVHYFVFGFALLVSLLLVIHIIWKGILMRQESKLIALGKGAAA